MKLSIIIPIYNEALIIEELYNRLKAAALSITSQYELIFVNDNSKDNSLELLKELSHKNPEIKFISFSRNFGHQIAVSAGLDVCQGEAVIIIDGDLQDPPELIPELYKKYEEGYKVVYAKRRTRSGETFFKKTTAKYFYRILQNLTSIEIPVDTGDFRLIDKQVVKNLVNMEERNKFLRGQIAWLGFKQIAVEFDRNERKHGQTGYTFKKMLQLAIDGITGFSNTPLRIASISGFVVSFIAFLIIIYALFSKFYWHNALGGWASLIISSMFIGGIQLLTIGVLGEYISRISDNVKKRPLYVVDETNAELKS